MTLVPVIPSKRVQGWPKSPAAPEVTYLDTSEAFARSWPTDAHFAAYSVPQMPRRLTLDAIGSPELAGGWPMVLLVVDVDGPDHQRTPEWWASEQGKIGAALAAHPGGFMYATRGGYRLVWRLPPVVIRTTDDKNAWRQRYRRELLYLARRFSIEGDPTCSDITRLYRLPHGTRDAGGSPEALPTTGDPSALGVWGHEPGMGELGADIEAARRLASVAAASWGPVLRSLTSDGGGQEGQGPDLRPEDQDEARVFKRASAYLASMRPSVKGANGNAALWAAALAMVRGFCLGADMGAEFLMRDFNPRCSPPWPRAEVGRTCRNVAERGEQPWGYLRDRDGGEAGMRNKRSGARRQRTEKADVNREQTAGPRSAPGHDQEHDEQGPASGARAADPWRSELQTDRTGYRKNLANLALIVANDDGWPGCLAFNDFTGRIVLQKCPPSHAGLKGEHWPRSWRDADDVRVALWLQRTWRIEASPELVGHAAVAVAFENRVHPVRDYLEGLAWDGTPRLARWLTTYLGVRETDYSRAVGACMLRAAVARIFSPGCKVDTMLVLQGEQGAFKSTAIKTLCGAQWFTDELADFGSKDAAMQLRGAWFIEAAELGGMVRAEVERVKSFISRGTERYRTAYGRHVEDQPRQCVFFGTTNADTYLKDETGNRRFWPVLCGAVGEIDLAGIARDRDQIWAEAVAELKAGARWHLDKREDSKALKQAHAAQEAVRERDAWESCIAAYLTKHTPMFVTSAELLGNAITLERGRWGVGEQRRVGAIMRGLGWQRRQQGTAPNKEWGFIPPYLDAGAAPMPRGVAGTGAVGDDSAAGKGWGTDGTDRTDEVRDVPGE